MKYLRAFLNLLYALTIVAWIYVLYHWFRAEGGFEPIHVGIAGIPSALTFLLKRIDAREAKKSPAATEKQVRKTKATVKESEQVAQAAGDGATASVTHVAGDVNIYSQHSPAGIPLQRPPRPEHFTGREDELAQLLKDLQPGRVVTLCGPGGMGKTALAAEALWTLAPGGIIFYTFYGRPDVALAFEHIVRSYDETARDSSPAAVQRLLASKGTLLVLDGTEEANDLPALLRLAGRCGVLITTRKLQDAPAGRQDLNPLPDHDALDLLQAWGKEFAGDEAAATRICEILGGLPLAIRLAGRYLDQTQEPAAEYLSWLEESPIQALSHGEHREQSVDMLLGRSVEQVGDPAKKALAIVGLLALHPFTASPVAAALELPAREASNALNQLVIYGLLLRPDALFRVSHPLIHSYARRCCEPPPGAQVERLSDHYTQFAREQSARDAEGFRQLDAVLPHLGAVIRKAADERHWSGVLDLAWAVEHYYRLQGHWTDLRAALTHGLTAAQESSDAKQQASCIKSLGDVHHMLAEYEPARARYEEARPIFAAIGARLGEANCIQSLGDVHLRLAEYEPARARYEEARPIYAAIGDRYSYAVTVAYLGLTYRGLGQVDKAQDHLRQSLEILEEIKSPFAEQVRHWLDKLPD